MYGVLVQEVTNFWGVAPRWGDEMPVTGRLAASAYRVAQHWHLGVNVLYYLCSTWNDTWRY